MSQRPVNVNVNANAKWNSGRWTLPFFFFVASIRGRVELCACAHGAEVGPQPLRVLQLQLQMLVQMQMQMQNGVLRGANADHRLGPTQRTLSQFCEVGWKLMESYR